MVNRLLFKLLFRELKKNAVSYLSMFAIVLLAVTLFLGFLSNSLTLDERAELYYEETNLADLAVQTTALTDEDKAFLENLNGVQTEYRTYSDGSFQIEGTEPQTAEFYLTDTTINAPYITEGEAGFLIDARVAEMYGLQIGDEAAVEFTSFQSVLSAAGITDLTFTVTGLMHAVDRVNIYSVSPVYLTKDTLVAALTVYGYPAATIETVLSSLENQALLLTDDAAAVKTTIQDYFDGKEESNLIIVYDHDTMEAVVTIDSEVEQSLSMLYVFPVIFFFVALLVVMTTVNRLILRERTNIGTMKALGVSDAKIVFLYASLSAVVALLGCVCGAVLGPLVIPEVMGIKYTLMFSMPQLSGTVVSIFGSVAATLFVCLCATLIGVHSSRSVIKENPAECMRPKQIEYRLKTRETKENRKAVSHARLSCRMALRNIRVNGARAVMTVIGVAGCSALLLTSFGIGDTLSESVTNDLGNLFTYDVSSSYSAAQETAFFEELDAMQDEGIIASYENVYSYAVSLAETGETVSVWLFEEDTAMTGVTEGGVALSANKAEDLSLSAGDTITFSAGGETVAYQIDEIVQTSIWNGLFVTENAFNDNVYRSASVWVKTDDPDGVKERLNEVNGTLDAQTMAERTGEIESLISSTNTMKYTLMVFAVLLSVVVLYNLSLLNLKERARDMATLKVLGYTHFQIALSLVVEIMSLTAAGIAIGCALGYPLLWLVMTINEISVMAFIITLQPISYVYAVLIALGTAIVINALFGLKIAKIDMTESLKSVE